MHKFYCIFPLSSLKILNLVLFTNVCASVLKGQTIDRVGVPEQPRLPPFLTTKPNELSIKTIS